MSDPCPYLRRSAATEGVIVCRHMCDALGWEVGCSPQSCEDCGRDLSSAPLRRRIAGFFRMRLSVDWDLHRRFPDRVRDDLRAAVVRAADWLPRGEIEEALVSAVRRGLDVHEAMEISEALGP